LKTGCDKLMTECDKEITATVLVSQSGLSMSTLLARKRYPVLHLRGRLQSIYDEFEIRMNANVFAGIGPVGLNELEREHERDIIRHM
jgi:hypothetical protein